MRLDNETLMDPRVGSELQRFVAVRYDADQAVGRDLSQRYGVNGFPGFVVIDAGGNVISEFAGYRSADEFIAQLRMLRRS